MNNEKVLLSVRGVRKYFPVVKGIVRTHTIGNVKAVDNVSFEVKENQTFGLVGESGCGKTTIARSLSEKQCSKRYASLVECKDTNYSTTKSSLL